MIRVFRRWLALRKLHRAGVYLYQQALADDSRIVEAMDAIDILRKLIPVI